MPSRRKIRDCTSTRSTLAAGAWRATSGSGRICLRLRVSSTRTSCIWATLRLSIDANFPAPPWSASTIYIRGTFRKTGVFRRSSSIGWFFANAFGQPMRWRASPTPLFAGRAEKDPPGLGEKSRRIYNCVEQVRVRLGRSPLPGSSSIPFFLCVAQHRRNKNILLALRTLVRLLREKAVHPGAQLVIVGIPGPETANIHRFIRDARIEANVLLLSGISEAELQWCYRNCEALLAPSLTEGFGLPVAEAL